MTGTDGVRPVPETTEDPLGTLFKATLVNVRKPPAPKNSPSPFATTLTRLKKLVSLIKLKNRHWYVVLMELLIGLMV
jgi:hypothetical protein